MRSFVTLFVFTSLLFLLPQQGNAANAQAKERAARKACLTGDPDTGISLLADLFIDSDDITYIFNQGRCLEQNQRYEEAIGRFREYLTKGRNLKPAFRADAERHIAICQSYLGKTEPKPAPIQEEKKTIPVTAEPAAIAQPSDADARPPENELVHREPPRSDGTQGAGWRIAGVTVGSVGLAGILTGLVLNLKANAIASDLSRSENYSRSADSSRKSYQAYGWIGYGAGAACLASGAVMYYAGWRRATQSAATLGLLPTVSDTMVGTLLTGAF